LNCKLATKLPHSKHGTRNKRALLEGPPVKRKKKKVIGARGGKRGTSIHH